MLVTPTGNFYIGYIRETDASQYNGVPIKGPP